MNPDTLRALPASAKSSDDVAEILRACADAWEHDREVIEAWREYWAAHEAWDFASPFDADEARVLRDAARARLVGLGENP